MKTRSNYTDREWEELASILSGEKEGNDDLYNRFMAEDTSNTGKLWKELKNMGNNKEINVDKAWDKVYARMNESGQMIESSTSGMRFLQSTFFKAAASVIILVAIGAGVLFLDHAGYLSRKITIATNDEQKNVLVSLPDGSKVYLNRNSTFTYRSNFNKSGRDVKLRGEAFFEIAPDKSKPFVIDAGEASVKVVGTSFNVITNNMEESVEVFVKTGKVLVSNNTGSRSLQLDPGDIGVLSPDKTEKTINRDPNYLSWQTNYLEYSGQKLSVVFKDLKRVYNMDIVADDPSILDNPWTSPINNLSEDTIIQLICASFNLGYTKDGNVYHLYKK
ncbi:MAG TPA: FecR domain-containing protein [Bacteroidales bacterium]|nr:FecR domain-containing protein [Bacteroidales bacterium]